MSALFFLLSSCLLYHVVKSFYCKPDGKLPLLTSTHVFGWTVHVGRTQIPIVFGLGFTWAGFAAGGNIPRSGLSLSAQNEGTGFDPLLPRAAAARARPQRVATARLASGSGGGHRGTTAAAAARAQRRSPWGRGRQHRRGSREPQRPRGGCARPGAREGAAAVARGPEREQGAASGAPARSGSRAAAVARFGTSGGRRRNHRLTCEGRRRHARPIRWLPPSTSALSTRSPSLSPQRRPR
jgi:hypothetical protein